MASTPVRRIVVVGGGTAGWLSAATLAARLPLLMEEPPTITLVESPRVASIGVGEGTWPTMRSTLAEIGIGEAEFLTQCDGTFKQGSRFDGWRDGADGDSYLHPFSHPPDLPPADLVAAWRRDFPSLPFAQAVTPQAALCAQNLAPRQRSMPEFAGAANYGYHLDASKLAALLSRQAVERLGVRHIRDHVEAVVPDANGGVSAVRTAEHGSIEGELFIDCSGLAGLLIDKHLGVEWVDRGGTLFNDRALALQVPVPPASPIASQTIGTAHEAGWIWDIGLPTRRGIGCVYSSQFIDDERARGILANYVARAAPTVDFDSLTARQLSFPTGHRALFWKGNCLAVGLAAGFIEPLEASAIVLVELSVRALIDNFPADGTMMQTHARRFNALFSERWDRIVDFLKLHYVLSERPEPYWRAHRDAATISTDLTDMLRLWRDQPPSSYDFPLAQEMFPAASNQYIYYGMGSVTKTRSTGAKIDPSIARRARALSAAMPTNRAYLDALRAATAPDDEVLCA